MVVESKGNQIKAAAMASPVGQVAMKNIESVHSAVSGAIQELFGEGAQSPGNAAEIAGSVVVKPFVVEKK